MADLYDLKKRADELAEKVETNSVDPAEVGNLIYDTIDYVGTVEINGAQLGIKKTYPTVTDMETDVNPVDKKGNPLHVGSLVVINGDGSGADYGKVYRYDGKDEAGKSLGWTFIQKIDEAYALKMNTCTYEDLGETSVIPTDESITKQDVSGQEIPNVPDLGHKVQLKDKDGNEAYPRTKIENIFQTHELTKELVTSPITSQWRDNYSGFPRVSMNLSRNLLQDVRTFNIKFEIEKNANTGSWGLYLLYYVGTTKKNLRVSDYNGDTMHITVPDNILETSSGDLQVILQYGKKDGEALKGDKVSIVSCSYQSVYEATNLTESDLKDATWEDGFAYNPRFTMELPKSVLTDCMSKSFDKKLYLGYKIKDNLNTTSKWKIYLNHSEDGKNKIDYQSPELDFSKAASDEYYSMDTSIDVTEELVDKVASDTFELILQYGRTKEEVLKKDVLSSYYQYYKVLEQGKVVALPEIISNMEAKIQTNDNSINDVAKQLGTTSNSVNEVAKDLSTTNEDLEKIKESLKGKGAQKITIQDNIRESSFPDNSQYTPRIELIVDKSLISKVYQLKDKSLHFRYRLNTNANPNGWNQWILFFKGDSILKNFKRIQDLKFTGDSSGGFYLDVELPILESDLAFDADKVQLVLQYAKDASAPIKADTLSVTEFYYVSDDVDRLVAIENSISGNAKDIDSLDTKTTALEAKIDSSPVGQVSDIIKSMEIPFRGYFSMIPVTVRKDGTGDFKTIQEAINSIKDASVIKQYDVQVYDDFVINDLGQLWQIWSPASHAKEDGSSYCALVVTKNYVNVRGIGSRKLLYIDNPQKDMAGKNFQNIQTIFATGICRIHNFHVKIRGGRYAIHQESGGRKDSHDYHATTVYTDCVMEHFGNDDYTNGSSWTSCYAQANGLSSGANWIYINCKWIGHTKEPFYTHGNSDFDGEANMTFIDCGMVTAVKMTVAKFRSLVYVGSLGNNRKIRVKVIGCNFPAISAFNYATNRGIESSIIGKFDNLLDGNTDFSGHSNHIMPACYRSTGFGFATTNNGEDIRVKGGTAYDLVWGTDLVTEKSTPTDPGRTFGSKVLSDIQTWFGSSATNVYTLAGRLGNCANNPKTLIIEVGGKDYTFRFDKNYMTADGTEYDIHTTPLYTQQQILDELVKQNDGIIRKDAYKELKSFTDCQEECFNGTEARIPFGKLLVRDTEGGCQSWRPAKTTDDVDSIEGISGQSINPGEFGRVILLDKSLFVGSDVGLGSNFTVGDLYGTDDSGNIVKVTGKDAAVLKAMDTATLRKF